MFDTQKIELEVRSIMDKVSSGTMKADEAETKIDELQKRSFALKQESASSPEIRENKVEGWEEIRNALMQKRAITSNGAGAGEPSTEILKAFVDGSKLGKFVSTFKTDKASSVVPVFSPHLALPVGAAEGAAVSADGTAVLTGRSLALKAWCSPLAISRLALTSTNIGSDLKGIYASAFAGAIDKVIVAGAGSGSDGLGVFVASETGVPTSQDIETSTASKTLIADLVALAVKVKARTEDMGATCIIMNDAVFSAALADTTAGMDMYKAQMANYSVMGVPIILSSYAPATPTTDGAYVAVGGNFKHYALALSNEMFIDEVKAVGSDSITFNALVYLNANPMVSTSFYRLKVKAATTG